MSDSIKKALEDAERLKALVPPTIAEELKRLAPDSALAAFQKLQESSALSQASKYLTEFEKERSISIPHMPYLKPIRPPNVPTFEETNHFQSAGVLLRRLADSVRQWRATLPEDLQPGVLALLNGGVQIEVETLAQESFHGIRIEGRIQGQRCVVLAHQATIQLLCIAQPVQPPEQPRRSIGFIIDGQASEA